MALLLLGSHGLIRRLKAKGVRALGRCEVELVDVREQELARIELARDAEALCWEALLGQRAPYRVLHHLGQLDAVVRPDAQVHVDLARARIANDGVLELEVEPVGSVATFNHRLSLQDTRCPVVERRALVLKLRASLAASAARGGGRSLGDLLEVSGLGVLPCDHIVDFIEEDHALTLKATLKHTVHELLERLLVGVDVAVVRHDQPAVGLDQAADLLLFATRVELQVLELKRVALGVGVDVVRQLGHLLWHTLEYGLPARAHFELIRRDLERVHTAGHDLAHGQTEGLLARLVRGEYAARLERRCKDLVPHGLP
mmetsp:Transcript_76860/g.220741  ORF Transcript_76860/g.220741 Transcript_76860/m.220741 type:complete len:315 (-) Transcript_76860:1095-2039(-)